MGTSTDCIYSRYRYLILGTLLEASDSQSTYNITDIGNATVYYDAIGSVGIIDTHWNMLTYVNLQPYDDLYYAINNRVEKLTRECQNSTEIEITCRQFVSHAEILMKGIDQNREHVLTPIRKTTHNIMKRGLINIVGRAANVLFGTCDDVDAERFYTQINEFRNFKISTRHLLDEQTTIIRNTIHNINETLVQATQQTNALAHDQQFLVKVMNKIGTTVNLLTSQQRITNEQANILLLTQLLAIETESLVETINYAFQGRIHSNLLSPKTLEEQLTNIKGKLPPNTQFPIRTSVDSISDLYKITKVVVVQYKDTLIFHLSIPIINSMEFIVYEVISLPIPIWENQYLMLDMKNEYLAIDKTHTKFFSINDNKLEKCISLNDLYLCSNDQLINIGQTEYSCEVQLFISPSRLPANCHTKILTARPTVWQKLRNENTWIYFVNNITITIPCQTVPQSFRVPIKGKGKITISPNCKIYTEHVLLLPSRQITSNMLTDFISIIPVNTASIKYPNISKLQNIDLKHEIVHYNFKSLNDRAEELQSFQNRIDYETDKNNNKKMYTYTTVVVILTAITIVTIMFSFIVRLHKKLNVFKRTCEPGGIESPTIQPIALARTNTESQTSYLSKGTGTKSPLPEIK